MLGASCILSVEGEACQLVHPQWYDMILHTKSEEGHHDSKEKLVQFEKAQSVPPIDS